jgi:hypothetical protein
MFDERGSHIGKHCLAMACSSIQLAAGYTMAHCYSPLNAGALIVVWACRFLAHTDFLAEPAV